MEDNKKSIMLRAFLIYFLVLIFAVIIIGKIFYLNFSQGEYWEKQASVVNSRTEVIQPIRGSIYAEDDNLLATSIPIFEIRLDCDPSVIPDTTFQNNLNKLSEGLSNLVYGNSTHKNQFKQGLVKARKEKNRGYLLIKKATYKQLKQIKTLPILSKGQRGGLIVYTREKRERPLKNLASMTIGYEILADYNVEINLRAGKFSQSEFDSRVDTLSECFANLFQDFNREDYKKKLIEKFKAKGKAAILTKKMDELKLAELLTFPLIEDDTAAIIHAIALTKSYYVGLEGHYRNELRGEKGIVTLKRVGTNSWKRVSEEDKIEPLNGCDLYTGIDKDIQDVAQNALRKSLDTTNADWGCVVLMEVKTGYIKAIANLKRTEDGSYQENSNYAAFYRYEPGSTFKLATVMAVLEDGKFDTNAIVNTGRTTYPGWGVVVDSHEEGYGRVSLSKAFEKSSNVGITEIAKKAFMGSPSKFQNYMVKAGLTTPCGIDLDQEPQPSIQVSSGDLLGIAFGYALKVTPLQMLAFYNSIANDGVYVQPTLVKEIKRTGILVRKNITKVKTQRVCSPEVIKKLKKMLEGVVIRGTATNIRNSVYKIAGKTGTAKIYDLNERQYVKRYVASFAGYFPADNPMYSCIVVEYNMKGSEVYGAQVAAPVFKEISDKVYASKAEIKSKGMTFSGEIAYPSLVTGYREDIEKVYQQLKLPIVPSGNISDWVNIHSDNKRNIETDKNFRANFVPDVCGMKAKDAVYLLESLGLKVAVSGVGKVKNQSPVAGTKLIKNSTITLKLSNY